MKRLTNYKLSNAEIPKNNAELIDLIVINFEAFESNLSKRVIDANQISEHNQQRLSLENRKL